MAKTWKAEGMEEKCPRQRGHVQSPKAGEILHWTAAEAREEVGRVRPCYAFAPGFPLSKVGAEDGFRDKEGDDLTLLEAPPGAGVTAAIVQPKMLVVALTMWVQ